MDKYFNFSEWNFFSWFVFVLDALITLIFATLSILMFIDQGFFFRFFILLFLGLLGVQVHLIFFFFKLGSNIANYVHFGTFVILLGIMILVSPV